MTRAGSFDAVAAPVRVSKCKREALLSILARLQGGENSVVPSPEVLEGDATVVALEQAHMILGFGMASLELGKSIA